jgi:outer membrane immunogenic protein
MSRVKLALCIAAATVLGISVPASAQPLYDWSGFYVGAFAGTGVGSGEAAATETSPGAGYNAFGDSWTFDLSGAVNAGGLVGYNLQRNNLVFGVEVDFGKFGWSGDGPSTIADDTIAKSEGGFATGFRGRLGYASGKYLIYGTAGVISAGTKASVVDDCDDEPDCGPATIDAEGDSRQTAGIFGAGIEYAISTGGRYQISIKGEWLTSTFDNYITEVTGTDSFGDDQSWDIETDPPKGTLWFGVNIRFP